jgi:hypothetical protein
MLPVEKIFGNVFNTKEITPDRLLLFAKDNLARLIKGNATHVFDSIITILTNLIAALETEVSAVDTTLNLQSGQTDEVDLVTSNFHHSLSDLEGVIANSLGGKGTIGFKEFYPHGVTEYSKANRKTMVNLTTRVNKAATKYAAQLGVTVTTKLQGYQALYVTARDAQSTSIAGLSTNRGVKSTAVFNMEKGLLKSIYTVGIQFPADVVQCSGIFNFNLLITVAHRKHVLYNETLAIAGQVVVVNRSFTDNITIIIRNTGTNADITVWIGATSIDAPNTQAVTIKPGKAMSVVPSTLGDADSTFLLMLNASDVNTADGQIETIG